VKVFLDTHAVVFLWEGQEARFARASKDLLARGTLLMSPLVRLELQFLFEIGRLTVPADTIVDGLVGRGHASLSSDRIESVVHRALAMTWTHDAFDRLIVATAALHGAPLLTRDTLIQANYPEAVW